MTKLAAHNEITERRRDEGKHDKTNSTYETTESRRGENDKTNSSFETIERRRDERKYDKINSTYETTDAQKRTAKKMALKRPVAKVLRGGA